MFQGGGIEVCCDIQKLISKVPPATQLHVRMKGQQPQRV